MPQEALDKQAGSLASSPCVRDSACSPITVLSACGGSEEVVLIVKIYVIYVIKD
jgi:hypothetical protein